MTQAVRSALFGTPWGFSDPPKPPVVQGAQLALDVRTVALRVLREYVTGIVFYLPPGNLAFRMDPANFPLEQADYVEDMKMPSMVVTGSPEQQYEAPWFRPFLLEDTRDRFGVGTVLKVESEHVETLRLEVWASKEPELRSLLAGLETAFNPVEELSGLQLRMDAYYGAPCIFTLQKREGFADADGGKGRRRAAMVLELRAPVLSLVRYLTMINEVGVVVDTDLATGQSVDLAQPYPLVPGDDPNAPPPPPPGAQSVPYGDAEDHTDGLWPPPL
jgi:hypothetical protein